MSRVRALSYAVAKRQAAEDGLYDAHHKTRPGKDRPECLPATGRPRSNIGDQSMSVTDSNTNPCPELDDEHTPFPERIRLYLKSWIRSTRLALIPRRERRLPLHRRRAVRRALRTIDLHELQLYWLQAGKADGALERIRERYGRVAFDEALQKLRRQGRGPELLGELEADRDVRSAARTAKRLQFPPRANGGEVR